MRASLLCAFACGAVAAAPPACVPICVNGICDGKDPAGAGGDLSLQPVEQWSRRIVLHISYPDAMGWASIDSGSPGDEVWRDRSFDAGQTTASELGHTRIPDGRSVRRTQLY